MATPYYTKIETDVKIAEAIDEIEVGGGGVGTIDAVPTNGSTNAVSSNGVFDALATKQDKNASITGATKTKITYDAKGLVVSGSDATTSDIASSADKRYITDAQQAVLDNTSGINTGNNAVNTLYSGLATSKQNTLVAGANITIDNTVPSAPIISASGGGGGGGGSSQLQQGGEYVYLGELLNDSFVGTSLGAAWSTGLPTGATVNNKLIIASGLSNYTRFITLGKHYLYEKEDIIINFKAVTKSSGNGWGFSQTTPLLYYNSVLYWKFNQQTGVLSAGTTTAATDNSMQPIGFVAGDNLKVTFKRRPSATTVIIENLTNPTELKAVGEFPYCKWGTSGYYQLAFLGGQQEFNNITINSTVRNFGGTKGTVFLGDSITNGSGASNVLNRWTDVLMNNQNHLYENLGMSSWLSGTITAPKLTDLLGSINGKYLVCNMGYNDISQTTSLVTYQANLATIATTAQGLGYEVIFISPFPHLGVENQVGYVASMAAAAASTNSIMIDVTSVMGNQANSDWLFDGVHPNDYGHKLFADAIKLKAKDLVQDLLTDINNEDVLMRNIPFSNEYLPLVGINEKGVSVKLDASKYVNKDSVLLQANLKGDAADDVQNLQVGNLGITGKIKNKKSYVQSNENGLQIGFNTGLSNDKSSNISITNAGVGGVGSPQQFDDITGYGNVLLTAYENPSISKQTVSGNKNVIINGQCFYVTLSGSRNVLVGTEEINPSTAMENIGFGRYALKGLDTGNNNIHLTSKLNYNGGGGNSILAGAVGTILIGTPWDYTGEEKLVDGEVVIAGAARGNRIYNFGAKGGIQSAVTWRAGVQFGTNENGAKLYIEGTRGTGSGNGGNIVLRHSKPQASGTDAHTTYEEVAEIHENKFEVKKPILNKGYTVSTLPTGEVGMTAYVTNALSPTYLSIVVGGGSVVCPVFHNGTNWVCH